MSKKNGALFSKSLFGYKKADVNEYIRQSDRSHDDQMAFLQDEYASLEKRASEAEEKVKELERALELEHEGAKEAIKKISSEYEIKLLAAQKAASDLKDKLQQTEALAASNAVRAVSAESRAESAEAEMKKLTAELDLVRAENEDLNNKLAEKTVEAKRLADFDEHVGRHAVQQDEDRRNAKKPQSQSKKKPSLLRMIKRI